MSEIKFGTDGWRAIIGKDFTFDHVERVAQAYVDVLTSASHSSTPIPLGFDRRFLSDAFAKAIASVLAANNLSVTLSRSCCPTPCISWMTKSVRAPGGIMVTASHNPYPWNGIKFKEGYGGSASPALTKRIEEAIERNKKENRPPKKIPFEEAVRKGLVASFDPFGDYVRQLRSQVDADKIRKGGWKIAFDPLFGTGAGFLEKVLEGPVTEIHNEFNPAFGGLHPEPIEKNLGSLVDLVKKGGYDVGLATDGDADRIGAVDERGQFVNPHQILALILNHLLERGGCGDVIKTVSTTRMVDRIAARHHRTVHETPIGFKHICRKFLEVESLVGGEESGGIGIPSHVLERDGLLSGLLLLEIMSVKKKRLGELLSDLVREIGPFYFQREDLPLSGEDHQGVSERLNGLSRIGGRKVVEINRLDGTKYLLEDESWLLIRPSGTEPLVRLYAEASDPEVVKNLIAEGRSLLTSSDFPR